MVTWDLPVGEGVGHSHWQSLDSAESWRLRSQPLPGLPLRNLLTLSGELLIVFAQQKSLLFLEASLLSEELLPHSGAQRVGTQDTMFLKKRNEPEPHSLGEMAHQPRKSKFPGQSVASVRLQKKTKPKTAGLLHKLCTLLKYFKDTPMAQHSFFREVFVQGALMPSLEAGAICRYRLGGGVWPATGRSSVWLCGAHLMEVACPGGS